MPHCIPDLRIVGQLLKRGGECRRVPRRDGNSALLFDHEPCEPPGIVDQHRQTCGQIIEELVGRSAFVERRDIRKNL